MGASTLGGVVKALATAGAVAAVMAVGAAGAADPIKVGYVEFPPYTYTEDGKAKGNLIEMMEKVAADQGIAYKAESAPARRIFSGLPEGEFQMFLGVKSVKDFEGTTLASAAPIGKIELNAYGLGDAPAVKAKEDLAGKAAVVLTGYSYGGWRPWMEDPANKVTLVEARTAEQALNLLQAGRAPILLQYTLPMQQALGGKTVADLKVTPISAIDVYFVVSRKTPDAEALLKKLEAGYGKLKAAGAVQ